MECELKHLCDVCVLYAPSPKDVFSLETDASLGGVGTVLHVMREGVHLLATELEGLALYASIIHFAHFLYDRQFQIFADHKALLSIENAKILNRVGF